jgi:hypothetical protein
MDISAPLYFDLITFLSRLLFFHVDSKADGRMAVEKWEAA